MTNQNSIALDRALFDRWQAATGGRAAQNAGASSPDLINQDPMALAAWLDGRATAEETEAIEAALAADPTLLDEVLALRQPAEPTIPSVVLVRGARQIRPERAVAGRGPRDQQGGIARWVAMAASIAVFGMVGFGVGVRTSEAISTQSAVGGDLLNDDSLGDGVG